MRSSNTNRNASGITRMTIREEEEEEEGENSMTRNDHYPSLSPAIHFSRSSIIRTHAGENSFIINYIVIFNL
jgi:hypothetical protein